MTARDIPPTRLEKAKLELAGLIDHLPSDRIGLVAFAGEAIIQCPLTLDRGAAKLFLSTVSPDLVSYQGTSLSKAIETAVNGFPKDEKDKGSRAIILLTDGEDQEPGAPAAAKKALAAGVRVYVIGIGTPDGSVIPAENGQGVKRDRAGQVVLSKLNENLLREIGRAGGGTYWRASRGELETDRLAGELRRLSQKSFGTGWAVEYEESFQIFLLMAWLLLAAEFAVSEARKT
jgi:Ca-activated chloride channel family protein